MPLLSGLGARKKGASGSQREVGEMLGRILDMKNCSVSAVTLRPGIFEFR